MGRILVLVALVVIAVWLLRRAAGRLDGGGDAPPAPPVGELVRCAHCGVHLPRAEACQAPGGALYCSDEHARRGPAQP